MTLTRFSGRDERGRWSSYEWEGKNIRSYDCALTGLKLIELFKDEDIDPVTKNFIMLNLLFPDPKKVVEAVNDLHGLLALLAWEVAGMDITGEHAKEAAGERVFDFEQDESIIRVSLYQAYGRPWDEIAREVTYRELMAMMGFISQDTPLGRAIYYRTAKEPKPTKYNAEQIREFRERKAFWRLQENRQPADRMEAMNNVANDAFAALERAAKNGRRRQHNHQGTP